MWRIDTADSAATEPSRPASSAVKFFKRSLKTIVPDWWFNMVTNEIYNTVVRFGITPDKADDDQLGDAIQAAVDADDMEYVAITGGTVNPTQSAQNSYVYNLSDFTGGAGLDTDQIRTLHIACTIDASGNTAEIYATYPDLTEYSIARLKGAGAGTDAGLNLVADIPINKTQAESGSITLRIRLESDESASFTIIGASQRTI